MATPAHCAFCFETLAASLEDRDSLSLREVQDLWARYQSKDDPDADSEREEGDALDLDAELDERLTAPGIQNKFLDLPGRGSSASSSSASTPPSGSSTFSLSEAASSNSSSNTSLLSFPASRQTRSQAVAQQERVARELCNEAKPLFVTWNIASKNSGSGGGGKSLRGCIGTF